MCDIMGGMCSAMVKSNARLDGKTAVITGCNTGIGKECTKEFYIRGAKVIMACRSVDKANAAMNDILEECKDMKDVGSISVVKMDLTSLKSVRECAANLLESEAKVDILLNNAGVMTCPFSRTEDGFEMQIGTNHFAHFLFTLLLMPKLMASDANPARVVTLSSLAHTYGSMDFNDLNYTTKKYSPTFAYNQSKLANVLFSNELARRLKAAGINNIHTYSLHPGVISTDLTRHLDSAYPAIVNVPLQAYWKAFSKNVKQGAQTSIHCCVSEEAGKENGLYYKECKPTSHSRNAGKVEDAKRLWDMSLELTGLGLDFNPFKQ